MMEESTDLSEEESANPLTCQKEKEPENHQEAKSEKKMTVVVSSPRRDTISLKKEVIQPQSPPKNRQVKALPQQALMNGEDEGVQKASSSSSSPDSTTNKSGVDPVKLARPKQPEQPGINDNHHAEPSNNQNPSVSLVERALQDYSQPARKPPPSTSFEEEETPKMDNRKTTAAEDAKSDAAVAGKAPAWLEKPPPKASPIKKLSPPRTSPRKPSSSSGSSRSQRKPSPNHAKKDRPKARLRQRPQSSPSSSPPPLQQPKDTNNLTSPNNNNSTSATTTMTTRDLEICQRLDEEYERALEEREIAYHARYDSVRQSAAFSVTFMLLYLILGTIFFTHSAGWQVHEALFFSIYTITTVGYTVGLANEESRNSPQTAGFQIYTIFYIFIGVAALTIVVAQVYQCIALEASRAQHSRDKAELARRSKDLLASSQNGDGIFKDSTHSGTSAQLQRRPSNVDIVWMELFGRGTDPNASSIMEAWVQLYHQARRYFKENPTGRGLSVLFPMAGLVLIGAAVVGPIEGWTFVESIYFACVSMTTVGYGDTVPSKPASIWFSIFWLPFSIGFMSLYLGSVARFYIRLSDKNISRLERQMRRRMHKAKEEAERERAEARRRALWGQQNEGTEVSMGTEDGGEGEEEDDASVDSAAVLSRTKSSKRQRARGFEPLPAQEFSVLGNDALEQQDLELELDSIEAMEKMGQLRRDRIMQESNYADDDGSALSNMTTMGDILRTVRQNVVTESDVGHSYVDTHDKLQGPESQFINIKSTDLMSTSSPQMAHASARKTAKKPSFALRVLVQERIAEIIAAEVAGFQTGVEIENNTLCITIDTLKRTADKWLLPQRARKAFRAVAFETLYFVGEHGLITRGADALYDLSPFEFHGLFSPLLAAMGDAETMEGWLASTNILADADLRREGIRSEGPLTRRLAPPNLDHRSEGAISPPGEII